MSDTIYVVYKHTSPDGKSYIGVTNNFTIRSQNHRNRPRNCHLAAAIKLYGWDSFTHDILMDGLNLQDVNAAEVRLIAEYNSIWPNGYNIKPGGLYNPKRQSRTKQERLSYRNEWRKKQILSDEQRENAAARERNRRKRMAEKRRELRCSQWHIGCYYVILAHYIIIWHNQLISEACNRYPVIARTNSGDKVADHKHNRQIPQQQRARDAFISTHIAEFIAC